MDINKWVVIIVIVMALVCFLGGLAIGSAYGKGGYEKFCPECGGHYSNTCNYCNFDGHELLSNARERGSK